MAREDPSKHLKGDFAKESGRDKRKRSRRQNVVEGAKGSVNFSPATPAKVEEIIGRTGSRGEAIQVRCRVMDGRDKNKVLRRNVKGSIQVGDTLMLRETEFEAGQLTKGGRGSG